MRVCPQCDHRTELEVCPNDSRPTLDESKLKRTDPFIGRVLEGKYALKKRLGAGGYGAVYWGTHKTTGGSVAVKVLRSDLCEDPDAVKRFYLEAQNTHQLRHPNTVRVSDFGQTEDGHLFLIMEHIDGKTLAQVMHETGPLPARRAVRIMKQLLKSLGEAHSKGVVHRDVKPQNIMLVDQIGERDFVKVLDFGISRSVDSTGANTQGSIGTPRYMAPEQWEGAEASPSADLYSIGCIAYEMLAGRTPFVPGEGGQQVMQFMYAHINEAPQPLLELAPGACSQSLGDLIMRLLAKKATDRPAGAQLVLDMLARGPHERSGAMVRRGQPLSRVSDVPDDLPTEFVPREAASAVPPPNTQTSAAPAPQTSSSRAPLYAVGAVLVLGLAGAGWWWSDRPAAPAERAAAPSAPRQAVAAAAEESDHPEPAPEPPAASPQPKPTPTADPAATVAAAAVERPTESPASAEAPESFAVEVAIPRPVRPAGRTAPVRRHAEWAEEERRPRSDLVLVAMLLDATELSAPTPTQKISAKAPARRPKVKPRKSKTSAPTQPTAKKPAAPPPAAKPAAKSAPNETVQKPKPAPRPKRDTARELEGMMDDMHQGLESKRRGR